MEWKLQVENSDIDTDITTDKFDIVCKCPTQNVKVSMLHILRLARKIQKNLSNQPHQPHMIKKNILYLPFFPNEKNVLPTDLFLRLDLKQSLFVILLSLQTMGNIL